jgi:hypothetical protein
VLSAATRTEIYVAKIEARSLTSILYGFRPAPIKASNFLASFDIRASKIEARCHLTSILDGQAKSSSFNFRCLTIEASDFLASFDIRASKIEARCHLTSISDG